MASLTPSPKMQFFDANGNPLVGGKLYTYSAGTTSPLATYTDSTGTSANTNPIILDSRGEANVWLGVGSYKMVLKDSVDALIWTVDNILGAPSSNAALVALAASDGSSLVGFIQSGTGAVATTVQAKLRETVSVKDFGAVGNGVADDTAAIQLAIDSLAITRGVLFFPKGTYRITAPLTNNISGVSLLGEGSNATFIDNDHTGDAFVFGDGVSELTQCRIIGIKIQGSSTSGRGFWGRIFGSQCELNDVYVTSGSVGIQLDSCYVSKYHNVWVRDTVSHGIFVNNISHNTTFIGCKVQLAGGNGMVIQGCYNVLVTGSNFEFNQINQIAVGNGCAGIDIADNYFEGLMPYASGNAGVYVSTGANVVSVRNNFFDATQIVAGADGTGTYIKVDGGTRVEYKKNSFVSIAATQRHVIFLSNAVLCVAADLPQGCVYSNASSSSRIYVDVHDERGVSAYNGSAQTFTNAAWNGVEFATENYDSKGEWNTSINRFTPKDYGVYSVIANVGINGLGTNATVYVRLFNVTDSTDVVQCRFLGNGVISYPAFNATFTELLTAGKEYQIQLYLDDSTNRNSIGGSQFQRLTIKRIDSLQ